MNTKQLRQKILDLAIRGKLVPQDPNDEPAAVLLERVRISKKEKSITPIIKDEALFDVPENWVWIELGKISEIVTGNTPSKSNETYYGNEYPFYKPTDLDMGLNVFAAGDMLSEKGFEISRKLPANTVLVTCIGATIGKTGIIRTSGCSNQQINAIIPKTDIVTEYIYFVCISDFFQDQIIENASATTLPIINKGNFEKLLFVLPPLAEQKRIVAAIESAFAVIDEIERNKTDLQAVVATAKQKILSLAIQGKLVPQDPDDESAEVLLERVNSEKKDGSFALPDSWIWCRFGDVCDYGNCDTVKPEQISDDSWVLDLEDIEKDTANIINYVYKSERQFKSNKHSFIKGQVLYSKLRPYLNKVVIAPMNGYCTTEILPLKFRIDISPKYVRTFLMTEYFLTYTDLHTHGVRMPRLGKNVANNVLFPLPPLAEQKRIVAAVEAAFEQLDRICFSLGQV